MTISLKFHRMHGVHYVFIISYLVPNFPPPLQKKKNLQTMFLRKVVWFVSGLCRCHGTHSVPLGKQTVSCPRFGWFGERGSVFQISGFLRLEVFVFSTIFCCTSFLPCFFFGCVFGSAKCVVLSLLRWILQRICVVDVWSTPASYCNVGVWET